MSVYEFIKLEKHDSVTVMTLDRPDSLNSWNAKMRGEMKAAVDGLAGDDNLRVLVITGSGRTSPRLARAGSAASFAPFTISSMSSKPWKCR
jgi:1,4-dihydroxy-2-naphthoyl-CoA synthase